MYECIIKGNCNYLWILILCKTLQIVYVIPNPFFFSHSFNTIVFKVISTDIAKWVVTEHALAAGEKLLNGDANPGGPTWRGSTKAARSLGSLEDAGSPWYENIWATIRWEEITLYLSALELQAVDTTNK
jgi:hypothetical protein